MKTNLSGYVFNELQRWYEWFCYFRYFCRIISFIVCHLLSSVYIHVYLVFYLGFRSILF